MLTGRGAQRLICLWIIFWTLAQLGLHWDDPLWWAMLATLVVLEYLNWQRGREDGVWLTLQLTPEERDRIVKNMKEEDKE